MFVHIESPSFVECFHVPNKKLLIPLFITSAFWGQPILVLCCLISPQCGVHGEVTEAGVPSRLQVDKAPAVVLFKTYDEPLVAFEGKFDGETIVTFIEEKSEPELVEMDK
jgi:hypothetical protein